MMQPLNIIKSDNFRLLKPNEKYLLLIIYTSDNLRFTISELSKLSDIHRSNVFRYIHQLADLDYIDLCMIGNVKEILKK
jgi:DNA-binding MarR family transcriptional regulator